MLGVMIHEVGVGTGGDGISNGRGGYLFIFHNNSDRRKIMSIKKGWQLTARVEDGETCIMAVSQEEQEGYYVISVNNKTGRITRYCSIPKYIGLVLDKEGRVKEGRNR